MSGQFIQTRIVDGAGGALQGRGFTFKPNNGNILVTGGLSHRVALFHWGTGGYLGDFIPSGLGGLTNARGITYGPSGDVFVASAGSDQVLKYDGGEGFFKGVFVAEGFVESPYDLIFGPDGDLYVSSASTGHVYRFDGTTGAALGSFTQTAVSPALGVEFGPNGNLFVASFEGPLGGAAYEYDSTTGILVNSFPASGAIFLTFKRLIDCNSNKIPDSTEIAQGEPDCNGNGILDSCETTVERASLTTAGASGAAFPSGVAVDGSVAILGSPQDGTNGADAGAAYVYRLNPQTSSWEAETVLRPNDGTAGDAFGVSAAAMGEIVVVGAVFEGTMGVNAGAAYVFRYDSISNNWVEEAKLLASDGKPGDAFGISLDLCADVIIVGAEGDDDLGLSSGAAYLFRYNPNSGNWEEEAKLTASDGAASDFFAHDVGLSENLAIVGAVFSDTMANNAGAAYLFRYNPVTFLWDQEAKLTASDGFAGDAFGISVDVSGVRVIVGAEGRDDLGSASGAAYLYQYDGSGWGGETKLTASDSGASAFFGHSVAIEGKVAVVGAPLDDGLGTNSGAGYVYRFNGTSWGGGTKIMTFDGQTNDWMGNTVGLGAGATIMATGSGVSDGVQGTLFADNDSNANGVLDGCEPLLCFGDVSPIGGNGVVNIDDLVTVLNAFGVCVECPEDVVPPDGNGVVNIDDLNAILNAFGVCP